MLKWVILGLLSLGLLLAWLINMDYLSPNEDDTNIVGSMTPLQTTINKCTNIAEQAAAHLPEKLAFQRMEKIGRQSRVMRLCMTDHGYQQSTHWTEFATKLAEEKAQTDHVSVDESYENLRREHMVLISPDSTAPSYWEAVK